MIVILRDYYGFGKDKVIERVEEIEDLRPLDKIGFTHVICKKGLRAYKYTVIHKNDFSEMEVRV